MKWFGWIPTLAGREVFPALCMEFLKDKGAVENGRRCTFRFHKRLYDVKKSLCVVTLELQDGYVTSVEISDEDENRTIVRAEDIKFHKNGLVSFTIECTVDERVAAMQVFRIIRDVYHVHTHHKHQDVLLEPVKASRADEAIKGILNIYLKKIVDYMKEIKHRADTLFLKYCSVVTIEDAEDLISQALGEMVYAENFCELFDLKEKSRFERARSAIEVLRDRVRTKYYELTLLIALLTLAFPIAVELPGVEFYKPLYLGLPAVPLSILFLSVVSHILRTIMAFRKQF